MAADRRLTVLLLQVAALNNRAMSYLKQKQYSEALADCCRVLELDPRNIKAILRKATAAEAMGDSAAALEDFQAALGLESNNKEAQQGIQRLSSPPA